MNCFRRFSLNVVLVVVLMVVWAAGSAPALAGAPAPVRQVPGTPDDICAAADLTEPENRQFEQAGDVLQAGVDYWAVICTAAGAIYLDLYEDEAPITVNSFVFLARQGYYNNTTFHRVLPGFMAQGGDPTGTGSGGPGYQFEDETANGLLFDRYGLLAMANAGVNTNGSQFFITYAPTAWLDGNHTIFGRVFQGIDVAERLIPRNPEENPAYEGTALHTVVIVEDPTSVAATPDSPPSLDHIQFLLEQNIADRLVSMFTLVEDFSHVYDAEAEAQSFQEDGGEELVNYMRAYLSDHGFIGTAAILMSLSTCPETATDMPVWALALQLSDYGTADAVQQVVFDNARADKLVSVGAYETYVDITEPQARLFSLPLPAEGWCGANGVYYRLEIPYGRYLLTTDMVLDYAVINDQSEPTPAQYLVYLTQDLLLGIVGAVLDRGNAAE